LKQWYPLAVRRQEEGENPQEGPPADHLGTARVVTNASGTVLDDSDFYPFGGERPYLSSSGNIYKFESKERDAETGNDEFGARFYASRTGHFLSVDWSAVPVPVPYANLSNPQTLNLYSFVADNPETFADLDGHQQQGGETVAAQAPGRSCPWGGPCPTPISVELWTNFVQNTTTEIREREKQKENQDAQQQETSEAAKQQGSAVSGAFEKDPGPPPTPQPPKPPVGDPSRDGAGTSAVVSINPTSIQQGVEYAGRVYKNSDASYSYTSPNRGTVDRSSHGSIDSLPSGTTNAGLYHTHGSATPGYDNKHFSPQDKGNARREHVPSYLATPGGKVLKSDPDTGRVTRLN